MRIPHLPFEFLVSLKLKKKAKSPIFIHYEYRAKETVHTVILIFLHQSDGDHGGRQGDGDGVYADYHQWSPSTISRDPPPLPQTITLLTCTAVFGTECS